MSRPENDADGRVFLWGKKALPVMCNCNSAWDKDAHEGRQPVCIGDKEPCPICKMYPWINTGKE